MVRHFAFSILLSLSFGFVGCSSGDGTEEAAEQQDEALLRPQLCAGPSGIQCPSKQFCSGSVGKCPGKSQLGVCQQRPQLCPQIFNPVCGCDGHTYANSCVASSVGVSVQSQGACLPPTGPFCGGIAGIPCPGTGRCVDDPRDDCDPTKGGADCGGVCTCVENVLCILGTHFDSSPAVCACVPDNKVVHCGGIAAFPCPGNGKCVDDPSDDCDPKNGGADCGGICSCIQNVLCVRGSHFDPSPAVCACVPDAATQ